MAVDYSDLFYADFGLFADNNKHFEDEFFKAVKFSCFEVEFSEEVVKNLPLVWLLDFVKFLVGSCVRNVLLEWDLLSVGFVGVNDFYLFLFWVWRKFDWTSLNLGVYVCIL